MPAAERRMSGLGTDAERYVGGNLLVDALPPAEREHVIGQLTLFRAEVPDVVVSHGEEFPAVLFPVDALFSVTAELRRGEVFEVSAVGRQGVIGAELVLDVPTAPRTIMSQVDGHAARMERAAFEACLERSRALARAIQRHLLRRLFLAEQMIACNLAHDVTERAARWILMLRDEVGRNEFELREEFLGMMLAAPRGSASDATRVLQEMGAIRYANETLAVLELQALLETTCECYEAQRRYAP
jgi:CRP-like cAMP-binding protein